VARRIHVPTLAAVGTDDSNVTPDEVARFVAGLPRTTPHGLLVIRGADHFAFGNDCHRQRTCAIAATYATAFLLTYLGRVPGAQGPLDPRRPRDPRVSLEVAGMP
jgi:alpha-beta hydrolase superfamily lysophospholipase